MSEVLSKEREHYVLDNLKLIHKVLSQMNIRQSNRNYEDYYSAGCLGLTKAAIRYDESMGTEFSSYAVPYIKGYIIQDINIMSHPDRISRAVQEYQVKYDKYKSTHPTMKESEIHDVLGLSSYYRKLVGENRFTTVSIEALSAEFEVIEDPDSLRYVDELMDKEIADQILKSIRKVTQRSNPRSQAMYEEYITRLADNDPITYDEIAHKYGVSRQRAHQVITKMNDKVKAILGGSNSGKM